MRVLALRADHGGCAKYRIVEPVKALQSKYGWDIRIDSDVSVDAHMNPETHMYDVHEVREDIDLLVVQRPLRQSMHSVVRQAQRQGIAVVVELDDDLEYTHRKNAAWRKVQPKYSPDHNWDWIHETAKLADMVTVSTPALLRWAPHGRGIVLPNCIPLDAFDTPLLPSGQGSGVGWTGTVATHPDDLQVASPGIAKALIKHNQGFFVVGDGLGVRDAISLPYPYDIKVTGWVGLDDYYQNVKSMLKVGVVPLESSKFNNAKSNLKGLEMAALGIPFVASPSPEYQRLADEGIGMIARTPDEWYTQLNTLLTKPKKAYMLGQKYRSEVRKRYVYENFVDSWADAWQAAVAHRKSQ